MWVLVIVAAAAGSFATSATADPVRPKATPLAVVATGTPARCPSASEVDGRSVTAITRRELRSGDANAFIAISLFTLVPSPAVVLCDPDLVATAQPLGPFGGATNYDLSSDVAFSGVRALGTPPEGLTDSKLVPGDRIELPAAGERSALSVMVATTRGANVRQIAPLGSPRATAVRIEGTLSAPVVVVERGGAEPTRVPAILPPASTTRVRPSLEGREVVFSGTASPGTIVIASGTGEFESAFAVTARSGRFDGLKVRVGPKRRSISVILLNLPRRQGFEVDCTARWNAARKLADRVTCKGVRTAKAGRAARMALASATPPPSAAQGPTASAPPPLAKAAQAPEMVEATVTGLTKFTPSEFPSLMGDVNGDGRPDANVNSLERKPKPRLVVSASGQPSTSVPFRIDSSSLIEFDFGASAVPDLDGDGRDELMTDSGVIVTDALASPTLPTRIDLRKLRPTSPRDIDLGLAGDTTSLSDGLTASEPQGTVADTTGDGRPEIVLGGDGLGAIFPSQAIVPGIRSRLAQIFPIAWLDDVGSGDLTRNSLFDGEPTRDIQATEALDDAGTVTIGGRLLTISPADPELTPAQPRTFRIQSFGGAPTPVATSTFTATGIPLLVDHDPASGDSLIVLFQKSTCGRARCLDRVLRINQAGQTVSVIAMRRADADLFASFIADGPDADSHVDVGISSYGGLDAPFDERSTGNGTIAVLTSALTGARKLASLPVLARNGDPLLALTPLDSRVLPNGTRWLAAQTSAKPSGAGTFALIGQKP